MQCHILFVILHNETRVDSVFEGEYQSGQMGQTVNLLVNTFGGSNPSSPTSEQGSTIGILLFLFIGNILLINHEDDFYSKSEDFTLTGL